jgi:type VI protein secretion system component Hcp
MSIEGIFACLLRYFTAVVSIALVLAVPTTATADLITLKLPGITGDVTVEGQQGTIEVLSRSGNVQEPVTGSAGGSRARSLPVFSDLMIHKRLDRSSPARFLALVKGSLLGSGVITFLRTD